jgi:hypothetical protein
MSVALKPTKNATQVVVVLLYELSHDQVRTALVYSGPTKAELEFEVEEGYQWRYATSAYKGPTFRVLANYAGDFTEPVDLVPALVTGESNVG